MSSESVALQREEKIVETDFPSDPAYLTMMGKGPRRIIHSEMWSNPDAETYLTGIDAYDHPRQCRLRLNELYPCLGLGIPHTDTLLPRSENNVDTEAGTTRWGAGQTSTFVHGESVFKSAADVFAFSPLEKADFRGWPFVVENWDYSNEDVIYEQAMKRVWPGAAELQGKPAYTGTYFYNTMFMWPMLTFGWELFLECCMDPRFERIMNEFAEINRRVFRVYSRLPLNYIACHDDIVMSSGPVCSPDWMHKYIFPRYEEYWGMLKASGKAVIFMVDGRVDAYVDDVMACGARGFITEPYTDFKAIARKFHNCYLTGEGDNRVLSRNRPEEIRAMVQSMAETGKMSGGYAMSIGNHIPWNIPGEAVKRYLDDCNELAWR